MCAVFTPELEPSKGTANTTNMITAAIIKNYVYM